MGRKKKEDMHNFSVKFPKSLLEEIDQICAANYITRTSWLINAAKEVLEKQRRVGADELIRKLADMEN